MDVQKTLEFAEAVCRDAKGDVVKMNRIAPNKALKFYLDNVIMLGVMEQATFAACYPQFMEEIDAVRQAAEKQAEAETQHVDQSNRIAALEAKMDKLTTALERFMASEDADTEEDDPEPEPETTPRRRRKKKAADTEGTEGQDAPPEAADEGEPEEAE